MTKTKVLNAKSMKKLGFTSYTEDKWCYTKRVMDGISFNVRIDKETGNYTTEVLNEHFMQHEDYMAMIEPYRSYAKASIDVIVHEMNTAGLSIKHNHGDQAIDKEMKEPVLVERAELENLRGSYAILRTLNEDGVNEWSGYKEAIQRLMDS